MSFVFIFRTPGHKDPDSALEDTARQEYPTLTALAPDADIGPEPDYLPFIAIAGVLLLEANDVAQSYLGDHWLSRWKGGPVLVYLVAQGCGGVSGRGVEVLPPRCVEDLP